MKKIFLFLVLTAAIISAADEGRFMKYPDIYKDRVVFSYEKDLWTVSSSGGTAVRLTSAPGNEYAAKFSPDGKWIAFTGEYDGSANVYVIPSTGGEPKRITYIPGSVQTIAWSPDGKKIVFRSSFENTVGRDPNLYFVDLNGSIPERFPIDRGVLCSFSEDGLKMFYCRRGVEEYYWKRYKGGQYQDIWSYDFKENKFAPVSKYVGKNSYPMWIGNKLFFVSDRDNGISNLYVQDISGGEIKPVSTYSDFDVMMPETDNNTIVFMQNGFINLYDVKSGKFTKLTVEVPSDKWVKRERFINPKDYIHWMNVSDDGETTILEARGDVFRINSGGTVNLSNTPGTRETYPAISPDGKWIAFFSDKSGEYQLYLQDIKGGEWKQLTDNLKTAVYHLSWSPDSKKILFGNKEFSIFYYDIDAKKLVKIDEFNQMKNDEFYWEISDYSWSPDSRWICYSTTQYNRNNQIFIYSLDAGRKYPVTDDFYDNLYPSFDANGKYLYYVSSRNFDLQMDFYEDNHIEKTPQQIMVVQLKKGDTPPFMDPVAAVTEEKNQPFRVDVEGLQKRTFTVPVDPGNYFFLKAGNGKIAWSSVDEFTEDEYEEIFKPGGNTKWKLHIYDMKADSEIVLKDEIRNFDVSANRENLIIQKNSDFSVISFNDAVKSKKSGRKIDLSGMNYRVNNLEEWNQIFTDAWRWYRDFFYDKNMHGRDWEAMGKKYREYIPYLSSREDLNWVLSQMVGELCVSHTYIGGGDMGPVNNNSSNVYTGWLGADLVKDNSNYYKFSRIYGPTEFFADAEAPLCRPDIDLKEGDFLIAINGQEIKVPDDYFRYLQVSKGQKITVTVNSKPSMTGAKTYEVEPVRNSNRLRYIRWVSDNIKYVLEKSNGRIGYMHITAMGSEGVGQFDKFWRAFRYKDGIIIDVRRNSGGWTEYFLIDKLERKMTSMNVLQGMEPFRYPGSTSTGKFVAISNENNGSDGEAFVEDFKANKLGKVVGVPSWGGLVGILNGQTTIDNGNVQQSNNAFYNEQGKWLVENHGADPDILVDNDPASVMSGKDAQLDEALRVIMEQIKNEPFTWPKVPAYPIK